MEVIGTLTPMALAVLSPAAGLHLVRGKMQSTLNYQSSGQSLHYPQCHTTPLPTTSVRLKKNHPNRHAKAPLERIASLQHSRTLALPDASSPEGLSLPHLPASARRGTPIGTTRLNPCCCPVRHFSFWREPPVVKTGANFQGFHSRGRRRRGRVPRCIYASAGVLLKKQEAVQRALGLVV